MPSLFRQRYEESLRDGKPTLYRWLLENGELSSHLDEVSQAAEKEFDAIFAALQFKSEPTSYLEKAQHLETLASQAREMVMDEILVRDNDLVPDFYRNDGPEAPEG